MSNSTVARFTVDFLTKSIVGSRASFTKAGKGVSPIYEELMALIAKHPDYSFEVKEPKKRSSKPRQTYKGMDIPFIKDFLAAVGDTKTLEKVNDVIAYAEKDKLHKYPLVKYELFEAYKEFDYNDAKEIVAVYRHKKIVEMATAEAAKNTASTEGKQPDPAPVKEAA